jgi:hypothetical protein
MPPAAVPPADVPPATVPPAVTVKQSQPAARATAVWRARRWQVAGLVMAVVAIVAAVVALIASHKPVKLQRNVR